MTAPAVAPDGTWLTFEETATALRLSPVTVARMFHDREFPGTAARCAYRIPAAFVAAVVEAGLRSRIDIADFARQWAAS